MAEHGPSEKVYCASERALALATIAYARDAGTEADSAGLAGALIAAHSPALGPDRSVCLRDVLDLLRPFNASEANFIERTFTEESSSPDREGET